MFTGIITAIGVVRELSKVGEARDMRAVIATPPEFLAGAGGTDLGASIACAGCCLTVTAHGADFFAVDISGETLSRTNLHQWAVGTRINLERAARLGDEMGGHIVSGHVDGVGIILARKSEAGSIRFECGVQPALARFIAEKGSVTVDGVSLTVNAVTRESFGVNIIPHTASYTTLGALAVGATVHIEIDMLARYVARLVETQS